MTLFSPSRPGRLLSSRLRPLAGRRWPLVAAASLILAVSLAARVTDRTPVDTGNYFVSNAASNDAKGWHFIDYGGDLSYWHAKWDITQGSVWPRCGKGKLAGSPGYPKRIDNLSGQKWLRYSGRWNYGQGGRQSGAYIWLGSDSDPSWNGGEWTHEINIWNWTTANLQEKGDFIGDYYADGGTYKVHRFTQTTNGQTFTAWTVIRTSDKLAMNLDVHALLDWLRARGLPNHYIIEITPAGEGLTANGTNRAKGSLELWSIQVPNL